MTDLTVNEKGEIMTCSFISGHKTVFDDDFSKSWLDEALKFRKFWSEGGRYKACRSCACYFAENFRSNIIASPMVNYHYLPWFFNYYLRRYLKRAGAIQ